MGTNQSNPINSLDGIDEWDSSFTRSFLEAFYKRELHSKYQFSEKELSRLMEHLLIRNVNGTTLMKLDRPNCLDEIDVDKETHRNMLIDVVTYIKKRKTYNSNGHSINPPGKNKSCSFDKNDDEEEDIRIGQGKLMVQQKLLDAGMVESSDQARVVAEMLSCKDTLLQTFLSVKNEDQIKTLEDLLLSQIDSSEPDDNEQDNADEADEIVLDINDMIQSATRELELQNELEMEFLTVKLVVVEQHRFGHRLIQRISPVLNRLNMAPNFGSFHAALIIGSWYLEWTTSAVIVPRKCYSNASILAIDLGKSIDFDSCDDDMETIKCLSPAETFARVAEAIAHWNTTQTYSMKNNCHHFVQDICDRLNLRLDFSGLLGTYMDNLKRKGKCQMKLNLSNHTLKDVVPNNEIRFTSHKELDHFVQKYHKFLTSDDMLLLKSFDLAFWLRHFANPDSDMYAPCNCYFGNPTATGSILPKQSYKNSTPETIEE